MKPPTIFHKNLIINNIYISIIIKNKICLTMKKNLKNILLALGILLPTFWVGCGNNKPDIKITSNNPKFATHVNAYTQGIISRKSTIKIQIPDNGNIDADNIPQNLFSFSPQIAGTTKLTSDNTIEFIPEKPLEGGVNYTGVFHIDKICDVPEDLKDFSFTFAAPKQDFIVHVNSQTTIDTKTLDYQQIDGYITTADVETSENIEKILTAKYDGKNFPISWTKSSDKRFNFIIDSIPRYSSSKTLTLKWNGSAIDSECKGEKEIEIPSKNDFKILEVKAVQGESQCIQIQFSDPISRGQDLKGLIDLKFEKENNESDYYDDYYYDDYYSRNRFTYSTSGNSILVYPNTRKLGKTEVKIHPGIQNFLGKKISHEHTFVVNFESVKPQIKTVKNGFILPESNQGLIFPFEAVNLKAVDVTIIKIFSNNVLRYIKNAYNGYNGGTSEYDLKPVGVPVLRKTIHLTEDYTEDLSQWKRYSIDLATLIKPEEGAIYNINISFRRCHAVIDCTDCESCQQEFNSKTDQDLNLDDYDWKPSGYLSDNNYNSRASYNEDDDYYYGYNNYYDYDYDYEDYDWRNSDNPCYKSYYRNVGFNQNIYASNIGIICKRSNDKTTTVFVTDLKTAKPIANATVELISYQEQVLTTKTTDIEGKIEFEKNIPACFVIAKSGNNKAFLKLADGNSLNMSKFDISGEELSDGLRGYIYGERGIWRPGDSIHLTFVLNEDENNPLPLGHPITFEVTNPRGQQIESRTTSKKENNFYVFNFKTNQDDPTGRYSAKIKVGNATFFKSVKVETVKPNRLKINTTFSDKYIGSDNKTICKINSAWLHGAKASNLKVSVDASLKKTPLTFSKWEDYNFDSQEYENTESEEQQIYSGKLDNDGNTSFPVDLSKEFSRAKTNKYLVKFTTKVFEPGGSFSIDQTTTEYLPYKTMTGIKTPEVNSTGYLNTNQDQTLNIVVVDKNGNLAKEVRKVELKFYKLNWNYWWQEGNYVQTSRENLKKCDTILINGRNSWKFRVDYPDWGKYYIVARDIETGYETSSFVYLDWPDSYGRSPIQNQGATLLNLTSDKTTYNVGEKISLSIPSPENGTALVSIENGRRILSSQWIRTSKGNTTHSIKVTEDMAPGCYINVMLLQPHEQTVNDLPIRMYGVLPINVEDPATILKPQIEMPDEIEAESEFKVTISEQNNKEMTYTIAIVEDGILDLTKFKTPNPWKTFYTREALGVKTWDMFDEVIGAFGGKIEKIFSIGGDDAIDQSSLTRKANRFQTVALFYGPFTLKGGKQTHTIKMPKYIGSVRTMVVAGNNKAYGNAEKTSKVTKPLMIYGNMPRTLVPGDKFKLPVTVFVGNKNIKNVTVTAKALEGLTINGNTSKQITFKSQEEQNPTFDVTTNSQTGIAKVEVTATSGNYKSSFIIETNINEPIAPEVKMFTKAVNAGETVKLDVTPVGKKGSNSAVANISTMIPINFQGRLNNLIGYPHGCMEQTISKAFPQLYLSQMVNLDDNSKAETEEYIKAAIQKVISQQKLDGGVTYWPTSDYIDSWVTNYAGHFMLEAKKKGYDVPEKFFKQWKKYQQRQAENWYSDKGFGSYLTQSYRLYTMALAGQPLLGAMNRLKEDTKLPEAAKYHLAAAYSIAGKKSIAQNIINTIQTGFADGNSQPDDGTYGSTIRDYAIILQTLTEIGEKEKAFKTALTISQMFNNNNYYSTQTTAYTLMALCKYYEKYSPSDKINAVYTWQGKQNTIKDNKTSTNINLNIKDTETQTFNFTNNSNGVVYVEIMSKGIPEQGQETAANNVLSTKIRFTIDDKEISPAQIKQGTDFTAELQITNNGSKKYDNISVMQIFPSGWEIVDGRIFGNSSTRNNYDDDDYGYGYGYGYGRYSSASCIYTDVKDDRVCNYISLPKNTTATIKVRLNASYLGEYYLPGVVCEDMYDAKNVYARTKGMKTVVTEN